MKKISYLLILDRSGSMTSIREQTVAGVNQQINEIKRIQSEQLEASIKVSYMLFDTGCFDFLYVEKEASELQEISYNDFQPRGGTPLNDAIAKGVKTIQETLGESLNSPDSSVIVTIFTDGQENSSREFTREQIMQMVEELSKKDDNGFQKWAFTFVGAGGIDEVRDIAKSYAIPANMVMAYDGTKEGSTVAFSKIGSGVSCYMTRSIQGLVPVGSDENFFEAQPTETVEQA